MSSDFEAEIQVTPEMIEAGVHLLSEFFDQPIDWLTEERARKVYEAMASASVSGAR